MCIRDSTPLHPRTCCPLPARPAGRAPRLALAPITLAPAGIPCLNGNSSTWNQQHLSTSTHPAMQWLLAPHTHI
eukprot:5834192-Alexandrium_andersonii.AAC.1